MTVMATYGAVHEVLLAASAVEGVEPSSLWLLLAVYENDGALVGSSETLVGRAGSNGTAIRRSALALADAGLVVNASKRGVGMRLTLTARGRAVAASVAEDIKRALVAVEDWRCECGEMNRVHEAFCVGCGAGKPVPEVSEEARDV